MNPALQILGMGGWEWIIVIIFLLLLFGSKKIPEVARSIGKALGEFERGKQEIERELKKNISLSPSNTAPITTLNELTESERLLRAAQSLGINTEGKTNENLREEIRKTLNG